MTPKHNINMLIDHPTSDSKVYCLSIGYHGVNRSLESVISIFIYMNIRILIYQNNPKPRNLDTVLYLNSAIATAISISAITIMSKINF